MTTNELLRRYVADRSEAAFAELVRQHIDLVYSAALRQVNGDVASAQDVAQAVFTDLARKAPRLARHTALTGWLYTSTRYAAANARRAEQRRHAREQEAHAMNQLLQPAESDLAWQELRPLLDEVMHDLNAADREAVLMRYFEHRPLAEIGARLGLSENTARMRVERALDKLRAALAKRGVTSTVGALAGILAQRAVGAAPAELAGQVSHAAFATAAVGASVGIGILTFLASTKAKILIAVGVTGVVAGLLVLPRLNRTPPTTGASGPPAQEQAAAPAVAPDDLPASTPNATVSSPGLSTTTNKLVLHLVAADSGRPIPSVTIEYMLLEGTHSSHQQFQSTRLGVCEIPVPRSTVRRLVLWTQTDGFADTWLHWLSDRGDRIPEEYTVRLARAVQIGGQVVDSDGQPVAGARVAFSAGGFEPALSEARPEAHVVAGIAAAPTDSAGRWSLCRIAPEDFHRMEGGASHPEHVSSRISVAGDAAAERQLLAGTYVFRLGRAVSLSGVILDSDGQPVPEAKLEVQSPPEAVLGSLRERMAVRQILSATNQADGTFMVRGCAPGANQVAIEAAGFVSTKVEVQSETNSPPLRIVLQRGKVLRLRVVDQTGAPVSNAEVEISDSRTLLRTDAEGRLHWAGAAAEDVALQVRAPGYISAESVTVKADGQEHLITLASSLTISGTVRDAATGQPVPHFRIIPGWPRVVRLTHTTNFQWQSTAEVPWISSAEGKFRQMVAEAASQETDLAFKFDAEGYAPFVTRVVRSGEGVVQFEVALRPAVPLTITALLPDGKPAAGADVGLVSPGGLLRVRPGGLARGNTYPTSESVPTTDDQGRFVLLPDDAVTSVIVANQNGFAEATCAALAAEPVIRMQAWGRIEGTSLSRGRGAAGRVVQFQYGSDPAMHNTVCADFLAYQANTDADGRFLFAQVPPGKHTVAQSVSSSFRGAQIIRAPQVIVEVEVHAGQTSTVTLGNSNYTVTARLRWPPELTRDPNLNVTLSLQRPRAVPPAEVRKDPEALARWRAQPKNTAANSLRRGPLLFSEDPDGTFVAENVPPGSYGLSASISEAPSDGGRPKLRASARVPVTVSADPPTGTLDLGEIMLQPVK